jgi:predicted nuclease of predicted toxin-antitoxin system
MPRTIRFHLDENCSRSIATGLRRRGVNVTTTPEVGLRTLDDLSQIAYVLQEQRVLFTQDEDFLTWHASNPAHAGIVYSRKNTRSVGEIIRGLCLLWEVDDPDEMRGRVEFL